MSLTSKRHAVGDPFLGTMKLSLGGAYFIFGPIKADTQAHDPRMTSPRMITRSRARKNAERTDNDMSTLRTDLSNISRPVNLTEDIIYMVNKKMKMMDKMRREHDLHLRFDTSESIYEVKYLNRFPSEFSETEKAVTHQHYFERSSVAQTKAIDMLEFVNKCKTSGHVNPWDANKIKQVKKSVQFFELPDDYYGENPVIDDCSVLADLAERKNGMILVRSKHLNQCVATWEIARWLVVGDCQYPLKCMELMVQENVYTCHCLYLVYIFWSSSTIESVFVGSGVERVTTNNLNDLVEQDPFEAMKQLCEWTLAGAEKGVSELLSGRLKLYESRPRNVLFATQLRLLTKKLDCALDCVFGEDELL